MAICSYITIITHIIHHESNVQQISVCPKTYCINKLKFTAPGRPYLHAVLRCFRNYNFSARQFCCRLVSFIPNGNFIANKNLSEHLFDTCCQFCRQNHWNEVSSLRKQIIPTLFVDFFRYSRKLQSVDFLAESSSTVIRWVYWRKGYKRDVTRQSKENSALQALALSLSWSFKSFSLVFSFAAIEYVETNPENTWITSVISTTIFHLASPKCMDSLSTSTHAPNGCRDDACL